MVWARIDDGANSNAKILALSDPAFRLWACGLIYCQANLTDGFIPSHAVKAFGVRAANVAKITLELTQSLIPGKSPLWHVVTGGWQVHDFLDWNDSRDDVIAGRERAKQRTKHWRDGKRDASREPFGAPIVQAPSSSSTTDTPHEERSERQRAMASDDDFARFWRAYPHRVGKGDAMKAWKALKPTAELVDVMLSALVWQVNQPSWVKDGGKFVPYPATWLRARRWEDEPFHAVDDSDAAFERVVSGNGRLQ